MGGLLTHPTGEPQLHSTLGKQGPGGWGSQAGLGLMGDLLERRLGDLLERRLGDLLERRLEGRVL